MLAHHAMPKFQCRGCCHHTECQRHNPMAMVDKFDDCKCLGELNASSIFLENVVDLAKTLSQILIICGVHECKAKTTIEITTCAFLHYDQICTCLNEKPKKCLRKENLLRELEKHCRMKHVEAHLACSIIKRGFKAFYFDPNRHPGETEPMLLTEECAYVHAAKRTAEIYASYAAGSCGEQRGIEAKIRVAYKKYFDRMKYRKSRVAGSDCNCCFCAKKRGNELYGKHPECICEIKPKKAPPIKCTQCCHKRKSAPVQTVRVPNRCPKCRRLRRFCICPKYQFKLEYPQSIWEREDFNQHYKAKIQDQQVRRSEERWWCQKEEMTSGSKLVTPVNSRDSAAGVQPAEQGNSTSSSK